MNLQTSKHTNKQARINASRLSAKYFKGASRPQQKLLLKDDVIALMHMAYTENSTHKACAELYEVSYSYWCNAYRGKCGVGPKILRALGLAREYRYMRA